MTRAQRRVLASIKYPGHLSLSHGADYARYFLNGGGGERIAWSTGESLARMGFIRKLPRKPNTPFWRSDFEVTAEGRAALVAALAAPSKRRASAK